MDGDTGCETWQPPKNVMLFETISECKQLETLYMCLNIVKVLINKEKGLSDLIMINGLYRHGFMISPAVLDATIEVLESGQSNTALELGLSISNISHEASVCV